ncbi:Transmembrane alpha-helix domain [Ceratobasidium sp. AG-Ba]|nr:Transmembrane alpha-helix domain [Ceratobasidium sp. AG-Ba]
MPPNNVTIDDVSALIQYQGVNGTPWTDSPTTDPELGQYYGGTYHSSQMWRASATFLFDGVAVYLYAAKRSLHGSYGVYLDGQYSLNSNGYSLDPQFKRLMYSTSGLAPGLHNLTLINIDPSNQTYTEIDFITWTTSMDPSLTETTGQAIPYTSSDMIWSSAVAWTEETDSNPSKVTSTDGASVTISFSGNGIVLYGKTGLAYGMFSVQVDGNPPRQLNASSQQTHSTILYRQDRLTSGNHTLTVTNRGGGFTSLSIGSAVPLIWSEDPNSSSQGSKRPQTNSAVIIGVVVGTVVVLAALLLFVLWFVRRRKRQREAAEEEVANQRPQSTLLQSTPFVLPQSPHSPSRSYNSQSKSDMQARRSPLAYAAGPSSPPLTSPGLNSLGSFDFGHRSGAMTGIESFSAGASSSGRGGPASEADRSTIMGNTARYVGSVGHTEYEESMRDRDAGPITLPQLPPAYSDASPTLPASTAAATTSNVPHTPPPNQPGPSITNDKTPVRPQ